jgi:hypothetical protein
MGTMTTVQVRPDKMHVRPHPLWDGIRDKAFDLKAIQAGGYHDPKGRDCALGSSRQQGDHRPGGSHQLLYDAPGD